LHGVLVVGNAADGGAAAGHPGGDTSHAIMRDLEERNGVGQSARSLDFLERGGALVAENALSGIPGGIIGGIQADPRDADKVRARELAGIPRRLGVLRIQKLWNQRARRKPVAGVPARGGEVDLVVDALALEIREEAGHPANALAGLAVESPGAAASKD